MKIRYTMRWLSAIVLGCITMMGLNAQQSERIDPDRPDQSEGVGVLQPRHLQVEWGVGVASGRRLTSELMLRYGLVKDWELRLEGATNHVRGEHWTFNDMTLSSKLGLFSGERWIPKMTLVGYLNYSWTDTKKWTPDLCLAFENELTRDIALVYNVASRDGFRSALLTAELYCNLIGDLNGFIEYYGTFKSSSSPIHGMDFGLNYAISRKVQLDASCGRTFLPQGGLSYASLGASILL